ncbi:MAG: type II toxin-antitoxin system RelE/ParE family toxin [Actinomycetia bacterium]|nr:type II toxin-antitoxin system RelE/ParE family toxin [Actinomycetes bacterium]
MSWSCRSRIERVALRKLEQLNQARTLKDLRIPPGNRLEPLTGDRKGQYSIRINDQYRICFVWTKLGPDDVEVTDYH